MKTGTVTSTKMAKTAVVAVTTYRKHPLYKKQIKKTTNFKAHDDLGVKVGQKVKIAETRPISHDVHFKILEVIE
ncbi:MAG: 30S ribosomal protein S17 [Patescibacteria group bacterium]